MTIADNLFILVSIVYGLAITRLLEGFALIARTDVKVKVDALHLSWVILLFVVIIENWWSISISNPLMNVSPATQADPFSFWEYVFFLSRPIFLYLLAVMLVPGRTSDKSLDLAKHYHSANSWIFGIVALMTIRGFVERYWMNPEPMETGLIPFYLIVFGSSVVLAVSDNRKIHGTFVIVLFTLIIAYSISVTLAI